jgi:hypothetical protein
MNCSNPLPIHFNAPEPIHELLELGGQRLSSDRVVLVSERTSEPRHEKDPLELRGELTRLRRRVPIVHTCEHARLPPVPRGIFCCGTCW